MSTADVFYLIAIIFMVVHMVVLVVVVSTVLNFIRQIKTTASRLERGFSSIKFAQYSVQLSLLKHALGFLRKRGGDTR